jgi:hypothetical protein
VIKEARLPILIISIAIDRGTNHGHLKKLLKQRRSAGHVVLKKPTLFVLLHISRCFMRQLSQIV